MGRGERGQAALTTTVTRQPDQKPSGAAPLVPGTPYTERELSNYCNNLLDSMSIGEGDIIGLELTQHSQHPMAEQLAIEARIRGAQTIYLQDPDPVVAGDNLNRVIDQGGAVITIQSMLTDSSQGVPDTVGDNWSHYEEAKRADELRWSIAMWPTEDWAREVYPDQEPPTAFKQLGQDVLSFSHAESETSLRDHLDRLHRRADFLNQADIEEIHFTGPGTDLRMKMIPGSRFLPCDWETKDGTSFSANFPTDEVFTTPDPNSVEGTFRSSRPLIISGPSFPEGYTFEEVSGRFEGGKLVEISGQSEAESRMLEEVFLDPRSNRGRDMIGELGLVDPQGRIGQSGRTYYQNIVDENAGSHLGLGNCYQVALDEGSKHLGHQAQGHSDIIIGSPEIEISATTCQGEEIDIVKDGIWVAGEDRV